MTHEDLKNRLFKMVDILEKNDIKYWLDFGTLLGAYRDGGIINIDYDIDIGVFHEDIGKIRKLATENTNNGTTYLFPFFHKLDIFSYIEDGKENLYCPAINSKPFPKILVDNLSTIQMYGKSFSVPNDISDYLIIKYSDDFDTPIENNLNEHLTVVKGGKMQDKFYIYNIEWLKSKITFRSHTTSSERKQITTQVMLRVNGLDGKIIYGKHYDMNAQSFWFIPNIKFDNFHTLYFVITDLKTNDILFYQKIVYSTDLRTLNMYRILKKI